MQRFLEQVVHDRLRGPALVLGAAAALFPFLLVRGAGLFPAGKLRAPHGRVALERLLARAPAPREQAVPRARRGPDGLDRPRLRERLRRQAVLRIGRRRAPVDREHRFEAAIDLVARGRQPRAQRVRVALADRALGARVEQRAVGARKRQVAVLVEVHADADRVRVAAQAARARRQRGRGNGRLQVRKRRGRAVRKAGPGHTDVRGEARGTDGGPDAARSHGKARPPEAEVQAQAGSEPDRAAEAQ